MSRGRADEPTISRGAPDLPQSLANRVYAILLDERHEQRSAELREICKLHPEHSKTVATIARRMLGGELLLAGLERAAGDASPDQGTFVGPFRLVDQLGEGGFGVVWLAEQEEPLRRQVALKLLLPGLESRRLLASFAAERHTLAQMSHPCIAQIYEAGEDGRGRPWFAMEFVPGAPITRYVEARGLDVAARIALFLQVCDGVLHAHQRGVIHLDIKPGNVLVTEFQGIPLPKIIDFGIAKALLPRSEGPSTTPAEDGGLLGTPEYMSPEQASLGRGSLDTRSDVYALGVLLFELLVGDLPIPRARWRELDLVSALQVVRDAEPGLASARAMERMDKKLAALLTGELDAILVKALQHERERRYQSVNEFSDDLRRYLSHEPVHAVPQSLRYRIRKLVRKHRLVFSAAALVLLALVLGLVTSTTFWWRADASQKDAARHLANFQRFEDVLLLRELERRASEELWPALPQKVPKLQRWLEQARALVARKEQHGVTLADLRKVALGSSASASESRPESQSQPSFRFGDRVTGFLHDQLTTLVSELETFAGEHGMLADVARRLVWAQGVERLTLAEPGEAWRTVIAAIAADPKYRGLQLVPQLGLIPLGADPISHLHEFAVPESGEVPKRDVTGKLQLTEQAAVVLVLLPGGKFKMGAQKSERTQPHFDPGAGDQDGPVHEVELAPFFVSKFELTKAEWTWIGEKSSAMFRLHDTLLGHRITGRNPEENMTWAQARLAMQHHGLELPTEAQWEYACRAGTDTRYYTGNAVSSLAGHANIADQSGKNNGMAQRWRLEADFDDGHLAHAPVGSFEQNAFGLFDMHGNVTEMCRNILTSYLVLPAPGDGDRTPPPGTRTLYASRGGSFMFEARLCTCSTRIVVLPEMHSENLGVRPVRKID